MLENVKSVRSTRSVKTRSLAIAAAITLTIAPALTGCFGNPVESIIGGVTGGDVGLGGSLPKDFPSEVPLVDGQIILGLAVGEGAERSFNVTVQTDGDPTEQIKQKLTAAGFSDEGGLNAGTKDGQAMTFKSEKWGVLVVVVQSDGKWSANYTVTQVGKN